MQTWRRRIKSTCAEIPPQVVHPEVSNLTSLDTCSLVLQLPWYKAKVHKKSQESNTY
jgi:hypothetical protein